MIRIVIHGAKPSELLAQVQTLGDAAAVFESAVIAWLQERDYSVSKNGDWETPSALAKRLGLSTRHVCRRRKHPRCPQHGCQYAPGSLGKRVQMISSNPALEQFLLANKPAADAAQNT